MKRKRETVLKKDEFVLRVLLGIYAFRRYNYLSIVQNQVIYKNFVM